MEATFKMPFSGQQVVCDFDDSATADEVIRTFVDEGVLAAPRPNEQYGLAVNGGAKIIGNQTLSSAGVTDGSIIDVLADPIQG